MFINKHKPKHWEGKHILLCKHCIGKHCKVYAMYCDIEGVTKSGRVRLRVYGDRFNTRDDLNHIGRIRYVPQNKVKLYADYFKD